MRETVKPPTETAVAKSFTNWQALIDAKLVPAEIICQAYLPVHPTDLSCHTRLVDSASNMLVHAFEREHLGGFSIKLRETDGKPWAGWNELAAAGIEASDFRCEICDQQIPFKPINIKKHMRPHAGKLRRTRNGGQFWLTLSRDKSERAEDDE